MITPKNTVLLIGLLSATACGGRTAPAPSNPERVVRVFMDAVKENDLRQMGEHWGTPDGPANRWMAPAELRQRLTVMRAFLEHTAYEVLPEDPAPAGNGRLTMRVRVVTLGNCQPVVPFTLVPYGGVWLVESVDLNMIRPTRSCRT